MLDELRWFLRIVEAGTFTEAARQAHLSQPALTAAIQRLEADFGARLFDRGPGGARPTAAGRALVPWAEAALAAVARGRHAVAEIEQLEAGEVRLAAGSTATAVWLPPILAGFRAAHPKIRLFLREASPAEARRRVETGEIDLAIVGGPGLAGPGTEPWRDDELVRVIRPGADPDLPFLTFPLGASHRALLDLHFPGVEIAMELSSLQAVRAHVEAGVGQALVSRASVARELAEGRLVEVPDPRTPIVRTLWLVHLGQTRLSPAASALRAALVG